MRDRCFDIKEVSKCTFIIAEKYYGGGFLKNLKPKMRSRILINIYYREILKMK